MDHPTDEELIEFLDAPGAVPEPPEGFERVMWARVSQAIAREPRPARVWSWRPLVPAGVLAAAIVAVALAGRAGVRQETGTFVEGETEDATVAARNMRQDERVLFTALDEHFQQAEALLVEVRNAPDRDSLAAERVAADDLVSAGRLYRQSAESSGHAQLARMLDDLEPVLVEVARSPVRIDREDRQWLRTRIDDDNLLFKVRAITTDLRERSEKIDQR